jgi:adenylate kinase
MIIFLGIAGSGKSSQGRLLSQTTGLDFISLGEVLRNQVDPLRQETLQKGELLPDDEVVDYVDSIIEKNRGRNFILDGFPRTVSQVEWLTKQINRNEIKVIHLVVDEKTITERLILRNRSDDNPIAIRHRIEEYNDSINNIVEHLKANGIEVKNVNGNGSVEEIQKRIAESLKLEK